MKTTRTQSNVMSPTKENVRPLQKVSPSKTNIKKNSLQEVLTYLKQNGIKLPSHLQQTLFNPESFQLKPKQNSHLGQIKSLKVKLNDTQFQLKKIEQDFALFKRTNKNQRQKQQKKWQESLQRIKQDSKQNNQDFDYLKAKITKQHQTELSKLKKKHQAQLQQQCQKIKNQNKGKLESITKIKDRELAQITKVKDQQYREIEQRFKSQMQKTEAAHKEQIRKIQLNNKVKNQEKDQRFESIYTGIQSQKKTQQKMHQKTKIQANKQRQKLTNDLCYERNVKKQLENELQLKIKQIKMLKSQISDLKIDLQLNEQKHKKSLIGVQQQRVKQINSVHQSYQEKIIDLLQKQTQQCQKYNQNIQKLQKTLNERDALHLSQLQELSQLFDARLSKKQDVQEIKRLQNVILRKDQQIKKISRQLKYCNLDIQNKEEVYNKIFKSATKIREDKRSLHKDREGQSRESLFRKSQTTDIKFLLKAYNKNFETNPVSK